MSWYAFYTVSDGELRSTASELPPIPEDDQGTPLFPDVDTYLASRGGAKKEFSGGLPNPLPGLWNTGTLDWDPFPPKPTPDQEIETLLDAVDARTVMSTNQRGELRRVLMGMQEVGLF